jgi:peroxidase
MWQALVILFLPWSVLATPWPYTRKFTNASTPDDEHDELMPNLFVEWLKGAIVHDPTGQVARSFLNEKIPDHVQTFKDLEDYVAHRHVHPDKLPTVIWDSVPDNVTLPPDVEAETLFRYLKLTLDPNCIDKKEKYWYRQPDGKCNWLKAGQTDIGSTGYPRSRDFGQTTYADGISKPREGPNPREVSNAFFKVLIIFSISSTNS